MTKAKRTTRRSTRKPAQKAPAAPLARPVVDYTDRFGRESDRLWSALQSAPALNLPAEARSMFPYNSVASSAAMHVAIMRIVRHRDPESRWPDACAALIRTDRGGNGFGAFLDAVRDVAFMAGVEYARRSLPAWWRSLEQLDADMQQHVGVIVERAAGKDGQR